MKPENFLKDLCSSWILDSHSGDYEEYSFWVVMPRSSEKAQHFRATLPSSGRKGNPRQKSATRSSE
jgi:hypothetical protein